MAVENKSELLHVRVTPSQAQLLRATANGEGVRLSEWLRGVALRRAVERVAADARVFGMQVQG
jgi:uncharacterized protein (DUF1778 family)